MAYNTAQIIYFKTDTLTSPSFDFLFMEVAYITYQYDFSQNIYLAQIHFQLVIQYTLFIEINGAHKEGKIKIHNNIAKMSFYRSQSINQARENSTTTNKPQYRPSTLPDIHH